MIEDWIKEAKQDVNVGMILLHNSVVRATSIKKSVVGR